MINDKDLSLFKERKVKARDLKVKTATVGLITRIERIGTMEDYELDEICENNRDCGNDCLNCPHYAKYMEGKCDD